MRYLRSDTLKDRGQKVHELKSKYNVSNCTSVTSVGNRSVSSRTKAKNDMKLDRYINFECVIRIFEVCKNWDETLCGHGLGRMIVMAAFCRLHNNWKNSLCIPDGAYVTKTH